MSALVAAAAVGSAATGGLLLAFDLLVMPGLDAAARRQPGPAADVMREINRVALRAPFQVMFLGATALAAAAGVAAWAGHEPARALAAAGAVAHVVGVLGVTAGRNVPLNERLAAGGEWTGFARGWRRANRVRTAAALVAAACFAAAAQAGG